LGRTFAKQRRNRGLHTGKSAAGWNSNAPLPSVVHGMPSPSPQCRIGNRPAAMPSTIFRVETTTGDVYDCELI
jgi:hypothetical protein